MLPYLFEEVLPEVSQWSEEAFVGCGLLVVLVLERGQFDGTDEMPGDSPGSWKSHIAADLCRRHGIRFGPGLQNIGWLWENGRESGAMPRGAPEA